MENRKEPYCVTCAHFGARSVNASLPVNVRDPKSTCVCLLHKVVLPLAQTSQLLICCDWMHWKGPDRFANWSSQERYSPGILYSYSNMYEPGLTIFETLANLPSVDVDAFKDSLK